MKPDQFTGEKQIRTAAPLYSSHNRSGQLNSTTTRYMYKCKTLYLQLYAQLPHTLHTRQCCAMLGWDCDYMHSVQHYFSFTLSLGTS